MPLVLNLDSADPTLRDIAQRIEVADRLTIGRGADNDLVLPDPNRHLSKSHCTIASDGGSFTITDTSTNGVFLNNSPERLPRGVPTPLGEGALLRLGDYEITVAAITPSGFAAPSAYPPAAAHAPHGNSPIDDALFGDPLASPDPFGGHDRFGSHDPFAAHQAPAYPAHPVAPPQMARAGETSTGPEDDIFGLPPGSAPGANAVIPDDVDLFGENPPSQDWQGASHSDHAPSDQAFFAPPKVATEKIPDDWDLSDLGVPLAAPAPGAPRAAPADQGFAEEMQGVPAAAAKPPVAGASASGDTAAIAGFLAAVGLSGTALSAAEKAALMKLAGEALVTTVRGLTDILAARSTTKQEFRIERTTIGAMNNNPLKFSASIEEAMRAMLLGRVPGFLSAKQAIEEALGDVKSHQLAVLAGMQVALTTVIARFDPAKLEKRLDQSSLIEGILPAARKARYWELFKALYKEIASELEDDFQSLFGAEFARAYKDQIDKL